MSDRLADLTDKEKETLRLIVRGHDAKSTARALDLSVHTINDRLRAARRKLSVTSSREAARILLAHERKDHEKLAHERLGDAGEHEVRESAPEAEGKRSNRIPAGVLAMMTLFAAGLILTSYFSAPEQQSDPVEITSSDADIVAAARDWLAFVDAGEWEAAFNLAGKSFRGANTISTWTSAAEQVRGPQGALISRNLLTVRYLNAPPHGYQEVAFETRYANSEKPVIETVTLQLEEGVWRVVGILVD